MTQLEASADVIHFKLYAECTLIVYERLPGHRSSSLTVLDEDLAVKLRTVQLHSFHGCEIFSS